MYVLVWYKATVALNNFKFATDVEKDIFTLKDLISNLEKAQGLPLVDSNKFGVLRESMRSEKREKIIKAFKMRKIMPEKLIFQ